MWRCRWPGKQERWQFPPRWWQWGAIRALHLCTRNNQEWRKLIWLFMSINKNLFSQVSRKVTCSLHEMGKMYSVISQPQVSFPEEQDQGKQKRSRSERKMWLFYPDQTAFSLFLWLTADWLEIWAEKHNTFKAPLGPDKGREESFPQHVLWGHTFFPTDLQLHSREESNVLHTDQDKMQNTLHMASISCLAKGDSLLQFFAVTFSNTMVFREVPYLCKYYMLWGP